MAEVRITVDGSPVPRRRWVLEVGRTVVETADTAAGGYLPAALCRRCPGAVLYLERWEPVRHPLETARLKQDPVTGGGAPRV